MVFRVMSFKQGIHSCTIILFSVLNSWVSFWTWSVKAVYQQSSFVVPTIIFQKIKVDDASLKNIT